MGMFATDHRGRTGGRGPSPAVWGPLRAPWDHLLVDMDKGVFVRTDFTSFGGEVTSNVGHYSSDFLGGLHTREDNSVTLLQRADQKTGVVRASLPATDNTQMCLTTGGNTGVLGEIATGASARMLAFEARVRVGQIGDNQSFFVGLSEEGLGAAGTLADATGALADKDFVGFHVIKAAGSTVKAVFRKEGETAVDVSADVHTLAADAWVKLGLLYQPAVAARPLVFFVNGTAVAHATAAQVAGDTFPSGEELALLWVFKNGSAGAKWMECDWVQFAQPLDTVG